VSAPAAPANRSWAASFRGAPGRATLALIALRVLYAYNWFSIGPALPAIGAEFGVGSAAWGLLLAGFFVGAGLLQVPAGLLARHWGTRRVSLLGAALLGGAAVAAGAAPNFDALWTLRFVTGAGAGLFFSPAISLVASLHPEGERGVPVGIFSSAYTVGAGLGIFVSALLLGPLGWRATMAVGGVAMLFVLAVTGWAIPSWAGAPSARPNAGRRGLPSALTSRAVWGIGLSFIGLEGASLSAGQYFVPYAEAIRHWAPALAGAVGALFVFPSFFGGPVGGRLAERFTNRRTQLVLLTALPSAALVAIPILGLVPVLLIAMMFSFCFGAVYAIMYILPPYLREVRPDEQPLAIGLFNGIQLTGGALVASLAAVAVSTWGYPQLWWILGGSAILTLVALPLVPATGGLAHPPVPSGGPGGPSGEPP
jgi:predicted MFS family arabinose efflux permease